MKKTLLLIAIVIFLGLTFGRNKPSDIYSDGDTYRPLFLTRAELDNSVCFIDAASAPRELKNTGKIYYRNPYIFVNERYKGVQVINISDPKNPVVEGFILAPGCIDMAVKGDIIYLDNAVDLVCFDLVAKTVKKRFRNALPEPAPPNSDYHGYYGDRPTGSDDPNSYIIVEWRKL